MTLTHLPAWDVTVGLIAAVDVAAFQALCPGGVADNLPQNPTYPCVVVEVRVQPIGTLGTSAALWDCDIETHIYSQYAGTREVQAIADKLTELLNHQSPAVDGWTVVLLTVDPQGLFAVPDEEIGGVKVLHWVLPLHGQVQRAA